MRYFDLHCDTVTRTPKDGSAFSLRRNGFHVSLEKAAGIDLYVQCYAVFVPDTLRGREAASFFREKADLLAAQVEENADLLAACRAPGDLDRAQREGKNAAILTVESAAGLGGDLAAIEDWRRRGVRMCTLTWNGANEVGRGVLAPDGPALTAFGEEVVARFENAGILVDLSHASPELFWAVAERAEKPLVASHSNAKAVCGHPRNLADGQFEAIRRSGGLVGLNYYTAFLNDDPGKAGMEDLLRHAEYFLSLGGEDTVALGGDLDGAELPPEMAEGLAAIPRLYEMFLRHYSEEVTDKIFFENAARLFRAERLI